MPTSPGILEELAEKCISMHRRVGRHVANAIKHQRKQTMFIEEIGRHLAVSSIPELEKSLKLDKGFWNVISIREPRVPKPGFLSMAKRFHVVICEDREEVDPDVPSRPPRLEDVRGIFQFVDAYPDEPILVHCLAGLSRSPAVALALIARGMLHRGWDVKNSQPLVERAVELLLRIRRKARPNVLFLRLCLEQFLPVEAARDLTVALVNHLVLMENRFVKQPESHGPSLLGS
jgi:predicted protein tyrosine phosphatase